MKLNTEVLNQKNILKFKGFIIDSFVINEGN